MALAEVLADQLTPLSIFGRLSFGLTAASILAKLLMNTWTLIPKSCVNGSNKSS